MLRCSAALLLVAVLGLWSPLAAHGLCLCLNDGGCGSPVAPCCPDEDDPGIPADGCCGDGECCLVIEGMPEATEATLPAWPSADLPPVSDRHPIGTPAPVAGRCPGRHPAGPPRLPPRLRYGVWRL